MPKETQTPYVVDCLREGCDGKIDLNGDATTCPKCGRDIGTVYREHEHAKMRRRLEVKEEEEAKKKRAPEKKGYQW